MTKPKKKYPMQRDTSVDEFGDYVDPSCKIDRWISRYCHRDKTGRRARLHLQAPELLKKYDLYRSGFSPYYVKEQITHGNVTDVILSRSNSSEERTIYFLAEKKGDAVKVIEASGRDPQEFCGCIITKTNVESFEHGQKL